MEQMEKMGVPIGDPRGIDPYTGKTPEAKKLAELEKRDRAIEGMSDEGMIEDAIDTLGERLKKNPNDADAMNQLARLRAKLDKIHGDTTH